ncbi:MAG: hypothetical protein L3J95_04490 [Thermoplasmata archaeon]|nr:hypothetical protein [Thermoplasmata archaeon]MCI4359664.1 hypothetical protein [Thermoplasmata archaeon]
MRQSHPGGVDEEGRESGWLFVRLFVTTFPPLAVLAGAIGLLLVETSTRLSWVAVPALVAIAAVLSAVHARTELSAYPVRITLSPFGLSLTYATFHIEAPWEDWTPIGRSRMTGGVALRARWGSPRGYFVTPGQARHLYRYPARPPWPDTAELFTRLEPPTVGPPVS